MANPIIEDFKLKIRNGNPIARLIIINVVLFFIISLFRIITFLSGESGIFIIIEEFIKDNLSLSLSLGGLALKPWTIITYMFTHFALMHIFWNMITLYWFGQLFISYTNSKKLIPLYLLGGITGALLTILLFTIVPPFQVFLGAPIIGASAGVTAIIIATATLIPNVNMNLMFIGPVKLIYVALFVVFIDVLNVASYDNIGGNISHLGGALMGYLYTMQYKKGIDLSKWINQFFDWTAGLFNSNKKSKMKVSYKRKFTDEEYNYNKKLEQENIDKILDKISKSGYESLSKTEKELLFKASGKK
ncbi:MAG: rhomboid family intramembrane serine protease [Bacteroidetes bacterium]|nr:rhomboid family intramembrane serine protease [Bacteroidota bacterium]